MTRDELVAKLDVETVTVVFTKSDGSERKMNCTRSLSMIPDVYHPKNVKDVDSNVIRVFDVDLEEWRSFKFDSVLTIDGERI